MPRLLARHAPRFGLLLLLIVATGCSFTRLGYENLDWFVSWKLRDYVTLDREQKRWLREEVKTQLAWHCSSELPRYRQHLLALRDQVLAPDVQATDLSAFLPVWEQEAGRTLERLVPSAAGLLRQLDDRQIAALQRNLAEQNAEMRERYLAPDPARRTREHTERARKRLEGWLGRLTPGQVQQVEHWSEQMNGHAGLWLDNREQWQTHFIEALAKRNDPEFEASLRSLILDPSAYWSPEYRNQREGAADRMTEMLGQVLTLAEPRQRQHLERKAEAAIRDLDSIRCGPAG